MEVIVIHKTKADRLKEFQDVLSPAGQKVLATSVATQWSFYLELTLEPVGWQALWKLPRHECDNYNLRFPTVVLVEVQDVNFKELRASVTILEIQEIMPELPMKHEADLKNLHPTSHQENAVDARGTANALDQLRFFYNHLWRPWDCDDSENEDWLSSYLEPRLDLYYDLRQNHLSRETSERVSKLIAEGRKLYLEKKDLESQFDEGMGAEDVLSDSADTAYALLQLHVQLEPIKTELRILENPAMRILIEKKIAEKVKLKTSDPENYVVWSSGQCLGSYLDFLKSVEQLSGPATIVKPCTTLQAGLDMARAGDKFILSPGVHDVTGSSRLEEGGFIFGIDSENCSILRRPEAGNYVLDVGSGTLLVQNVMVDSCNVDFAFLVRPRGSLDLTNVRLNSPKCTIGVVVLPGGHLRMNHCEFKSCQIGVFCHPGASVIMSNTQISGCSVGLHAKAFGGTEVKLENSGISDCRSAAIEVIDSSLSTAGPVEILKDFVGISCSNLDAKCNKVDVIIQPQNSILEDDKLGCYY